MAEPEALVAGQTLKSYKIHIAPGENRKDYVNIYVLGGTIVSRHKISDLDTKLSGKGFLRIHRSFIINIKNMTAFTENDIEIGGIELPIGESYKEYILKILSDDK